MRKKEEKVIEQSYYVTSGMYQKECQLYRGSVLPESVLPKWLRGGKKNENRRIRIKQ